MGLILVMCRSSYRESMFRAKAMLENEMEELRWVISSDGEKRRETKRK